MEYSPLDDEYERISDIGTGTYGTVFKARDRKTNEIVAIKRIFNTKQDLEGFPKIVLREILALNKLSTECQNIVKLEHVLTRDKVRNVYLIFEYCDYDMLEVIQNIQLSVPQVKTYMRQILLALKVIHSNGILHRDVKPNNILISFDNVVKIADFGLARTHYENENRLYTEKVSAKWYRPPEMILGERRYGFSLDVWALGCTFYEMMTGKLLFQGETDIEILHSIINIFGPPDKEDWPEWTQLPNSSIISGFKGPKPNPRKYFEKNLPAEFHDSIDLLLAMLQLNPKKRISAGDAFLHSYLDSPTNQYVPENLPLLILRENFKSETQFKGQESHAYIKHKICNEFSVKELRPTPITPPEIPGIFD